MKYNPDSVKQLRALLSRAKSMEELSELMDDILADHRTADHYDILLNFAALYKWRFKASTFTEKQWLEMLKQIKDIQVRAKVASIIWWDHAPHCDKLRLMQPQYTRGVDDTEAIYTELVRIGYPEKQARKRCKQPKDSHYRPGGKAKNKKPA